MIKGLSIYFSLLFFIGCATVTRGIDEVYVVESNPPGAKVSIQYDEPVVLYVEDKEPEAETGDIGINEGERETITLERLEGVTPATFRIPRRGEFTVRIEKPGYIPVVTHVKTQIATYGGAALAGNICLGGCIGAAVDTGSGATLEHVPEKISVTLVKAEDENKPAN